MWQNCTQEWNQVHGDRKKCPKEDERKGRGRQIRDGETRGWRRGGQRSRGGRRGQQWSRPVRPFEVSMCVTALMSALECVSACVFYALYTLCVVCSCMCVRVCVSSPMYNKSWSARQCRSLSPTLPLPLPFERRQSHSSVCVWKCVCSSLIVLIVVRRRLNAVNSRPCHFGGKFLKHWDCLLLHVATSLARNVTWATCQSTTLIDSLQKQKQTTRCFFCFFVFIFPTVSKLGWQTAEPDLHYRGGCDVCQEKAAHVQQQHIRSDPLICVAPHVHCVLLA